MYTRDFPGKEPPDGYHGNAFPEGEGCACPPEKEPGACDCRPAKMPGFGLPRPFHRIKWNDFLSGDLLLVVVAILLLTGGDDGCEQSDDDLWLLLLLLYFMK